jgi:hypothetical protein
MIFAKGHRMTPKPKKQTPKHDSLLLRMEPGEKEAFRAAARFAGIPLSAWMRERLRRAARRELEEARQPIPFLDHVLSELRHGQRSG